MTNPYISKRWPGTLERKIDFYEVATGNYLASSNCYRTCRDARRGYALTLGIAEKLVKARYAKPSNLLNFTHNTN